MIKMFLSGFFLAVIIDHQLADPGFNASSKIFGGGISPSLLRRAETLRTVLVPLPRIGYRVSLDLGRPNWKPRYSMSDAMVEVRE